jgi:hypothetical protein
MHNKVIVKVKVYEVCYVVLVELHIDVAFSIGDTCRKVAAGSDKR